jgi:flagellar hook assembly protein FlgD
MRLSFALAHPARATLALYDVKGRVVRRLVDEELSAGPQARSWNGLDDRGRAVPSGRYFARLTAGARTETLGVLRLR